ncbi:site-specific integrase [Domibacillus sp. PGB-M46]|uniref:site-specific integrase n=1 Tax=Domibacillus sp. PGB-M46 TaxID=2910255 RepID=UPI001F591B2C|nr:site-specific integrase [Domibacillus sp. PGB-M46]MCI2253435.1 site-specific integrase [Domibacillus sp. PGB-M46]
MKGSVRKDGNNWLYEVTIKVDPITGKRTRKKKRGFKTKREAEKALAVLLNELASETYLEPSNTPFQEYLADWFQTKRKQIGTQTAKSYESYIRYHIVPSLGEYPLSKLTTIIVQKFINSLIDKGLSSATVKKIYNILNNSIQRAMNLELIPKNVVSNVELPHIKKNKIQVWDTEEVKLFLKFAKESRYYIAFHLAVTTGMRQGELLGLRWKDVDLDRGTIHLRQTLSHDGKDFIEGAKTASSIRSITLLTQTVASLKKHKAKIMREKLKAGTDYTDYDLVICTCYGTVLSPRNLLRTFKALSKKAKVPEIRFHDLRHTHATSLLLEGINPKIVAERLGHSKVSVTLDTYSHVLPNMQKEAAEKLNKTLFG